VKIVTSGYFFTSQMCEYALIIIKVLHNLQQLPLHITLLHLNFSLLKTFKAPGNARRISNSHHKHPSCYFVT